jgi:hypothetical protein
MPFPQEKGLAKPFPSAARLRLNLGFSGYRKKELARFRDKNVSRPKREGLADLQFKLLSVGSWG